MIAKAGHQPLRNACFFSTDFQHQRQSWMALWWQKQDTTLSETPAFLVLTFNTKGKAEWLYDGKSRTPPSQKRLLFWCWLSTPKAKLNGCMMAKAGRQPLRNACFFGTDFQHQRQSWMAVWWQKQDASLSGTPAVLVLTFNTKGKAEWLYDGKSRTPPSQKRLLF